MRYRTQEEIDLVIRLNSENYTQAKIVKETGFSVKFVGKVYKKYRLKNKYRASFEDLTDRQFGTLTVIKESYKDKKKILWECKCECGEICYRQAYQIKNQYKHGCDKCLDIGKLLAKGYEEIPNHFWLRVKRSASVRKWDFEISIEFGWELFLKQGRRCALTGLELKFVRETAKTKMRDTTASLDRIDSTKGYAEDNVQWVHKEINYMKQELPESKLFEYCKLIYDYKNLQAV